MKKILLLSTLGLFFIQCNKKNNENSPIDKNDLEHFELVDKVCEVNQKVILIEQTNFSIPEKNAVFNFNTKGYLIAEKIFDDKGTLKEENIYLRQKYPTLKKQFVSDLSYTTTQTVYDSLFNIVEVKKATHENHIIEAQKNKLHNNFIIQEDYYTSGSNTPIQSIKNTHEGDLVKTKVVYNQQNKIIDSIVFEYKNKNILKETRFNDQKQITSKILFTYDKDNVTSITYLDSKGKEEAVEKYTYNDHNDLTYKYAYNSFDKSKYEEFYVYNKQNKLEQTSVKLNDVQFLTTVQKFDSKNNLLSIETNNSNTKEKFSKKFNYVYDKKGNWISKGVKTNDIVTYKVTRDIKYCN